MPAARSRRLIVRAGMLVGDLSGAEQAPLRQILDGMLRERIGEDGRAVITNPVRIGIGTK
jgi:hypothetical protein